MQTHQPVIVFENSLASAASKFGYTKETFFSFFDDANYDLYDIFGTEISEEHWASVGEGVAWNFVGVHRDSPAKEKFPSILQGHVDELVTALSKSRPNQS